jgi:hypothetical protein
MAQVQSQSTDGTWAHVGPMLESHPSRTSINRASLQSCIEACLDCAQACTSCADACLGEGDPRPLSRCIRLNLDCASLCRAVGEILSRQTAFEPQLARTALDACALACKFCGDECLRHGERMSHCKVCAGACNTCEEQCRQLAALLVTA